MPACSVSIAPRAFFRAFVRGKASRVTAKRHVSAFTVVWTCIVE
jgi:uncharacterized membrane protein